MEAFSSLLFAAFAVLLLAGVSSHANPSIQGRIIGGYDAPINHFTYQVSVRQGKEHICSGVILSQRWVLTACSCVKDLKTKQIQIYYGTRFLTNDGQITKVFQIFRHPEFNEKNLANNIAMLSTSSDMVFVQNMIGPVTLPTQEPKDFGVAIVSGWGVTMVRNFIHFL